MLRTLVRTLALALAFAIVVSARSAGAASIAIACSALGQEFALCKSGAEAWANLAAAMKAVRATGVDVEEVSFDLGADRYLRDGHVLDEADVERFRGCDAILKGPLGPRFASAQS